MNEYADSRDEAWIEQMSIQVENKWTNLLVICGFFFLFRYMAMVALNRSKESMTNWKDLTRRKFGSTGYVRGDILRFLSVAGKRNFCFLIMRMKITLRSGTIPRYLGFVNAAFPGLQMKNVI